nr:hypothetical protein [Tanacetum cinerariifolium]
MVTLGRVANDSSDAPDGYYDCFEHLRSGEIVLSPPRPRLSVPPTVIENFSTRLGNLEYRHGVLVRKMEDVSDAEVADSIAIGEIHPRVATVGEQLRTRVTELESHVGILMAYMLWMEDRLTVLEKRLPGPPPGPQ